MLEFLFQQVISCSFTGSYVILAVLVARFLLRKAPKSYSFALWSVVCFRLLCPFTFESSFGMLPKIQSNLMVNQNNSFNADGEGLVGFDTMNQEKDTVEVADFPQLTSKVERFSEIEGETSVSGEEKSLNYFLLFWCVGVAIFASFSFLSMMKLGKKLRVSLHSRKNIYLVDSIDTPFVWGLVKPKIYLPSTLSEEQLHYVIPHEEFHIKRGDHITRLVGFFTLIIHWFNPLVWVAFVLSGRDMELSVDEKVVKGLMKEEKNLESKEKISIQKNYATSLLELGVKNNSFAVMYVAPTFGRSEIKERVKNIMNMKKTTLWVSGLSTVLVLGMAVGFAMEQPESGESTPFSVFSQGKTEKIPTNLEVFGDLTWVNEDVSSANELSKVFRIAVAVLEDWEKSIGTTVTWHTTATDGIYVSTNEEEGNKLIQKEIALTLGTNGERFGAARSEWGKESDITFILSSIDGVPHFYTENESVAYLLGISTSPDDLTSIPESDPSPMNPNDEASMYEYYAFNQDIAAMNVVLETYMHYFFAEKEDFTVGDTLTWTLDRENPSKFVVNQQNGNTVQGYVDEMLEIHGTDAVPFDMPSVSETLKEVAVTFEVAQSVDGTLFLFTEDPFISTTFSIPMNEKEEFDRMEVEHNWLLVNYPSEDWWKTGYVEEDLQIDISAATEVMKISRIVVVQADEIPEGVTVTWHSDLAADSQQPQLTVTGENEEFRAYMERELFNVFEEHGALIGYSRSDEAKEIPFSFTIESDVDGVPQFIVHDEFWVNHLNIPY